ncbi:MAG: type II toxin-antitoxin system VapC family toxin [Burkholderiales bacterium]
MLDTDTCSYVIRGVSEKLDKKISVVRPHNLCISVITQAELLFGVERKGGPPKLAGLVSKFLQKIPSLPWDDEAARWYARIRAGLEAQGKPIGNLDLLIASHALAMDCVLITNNERHFGKVPGLTVENWS